MRCDAMRDEVQRDGSIAVQGQPGAAGMPRRPFPVDLSGDRKVDHVSG